jgi:hypothetical protein
MRVFVHLALPIFIHTSSPPPAARQVMGSSLPSGRLIEVFSDGFKANLDADAAARLESQGAEDVANDPFTPNTTSAWKEATPIGTITLGSMIHRGVGSAVFQVYEFPQFLIKYQVHCSALNSEIHPLLRDAWYMKASRQAIGRSPEVHFVSPPSGICLRRGGKCEFTMAPADWQTCVDQQGTLRYMIMDRSRGQSLHRFRMDRFASANGAMRFRDAMLVGRSLISLLQRLHEEAEIVHGDIHTPNIMIEQDVVSRSFRLQLIDFGNAFRRSNEKLPESPIWPAGHWFHQLWSAWQIAGYAWGPRDDIMRAIQTIAHLMHSNDYFEFERQIARLGYRALQSWKTLGNWFILDRESDPVAALAVPEDNKRRIYEMLEYILRLGRGMQINQRPPYEELIGVMTQCVDLALPSTPVSTTSEPTIESSTETIPSTNI